MEAESERRYQYRRYRKKWKQMKAALSLDWPTAVEDFMVKNTQTLAECVLKF